MESNDLCGGGWDGVVTQKARGGVGPVRGRALQGCIPIFNT